MKSEVSHSNSSIASRADALVRSTAETPATRLIGLAGSTAVSKRCTSLAQTAVIRFLCDLFSSFLMFVVHFNAYFVCSVSPGSVETDVG